MPGTTTMTHEPDHTRTVHLPASGMVDLRPDLRVAWRSMRSRVAGLVTLAAVVGVAAGPTALAVSVAVVVVAVAGTALSVATTRVQVTSRTLTVRRGGRVTTVRLDGRQRGLLCTIRRGGRGAGPGAGGSSARRVAHLSVADAIGRRISLSGTAFTPAALAEVAELTGATALACHEPLTPGQARAAAPGVVSGLVPWAGLTVMLVAGAVAVAGLLALGS